MRKQNALKNYVKTISIPMKIKIRAGWNKSQKERFLAGRSTGSGGIYGRKRTKTRKLAKIDNPSLIALLDKKYKSLKYLKDSNFWKVDTKLATAQAVLVKRITEKKGASKDLTRLGNLGVGATRQAYVKRGKEQNNAPSTVRKKGFNNFMIDTTQLVRSASWWKR